MPSSLPSCHSPGAGTEVRDTANAILLSILRSIGTNRTALEDRNNNIGATESIVQSRCLSSERLDTERLDSPEGYELLTVDKLLTSSIDAPSSQLCSPRMSPAPPQQVSVITSNSESEAEGNTAIKPSGMLEYEHNIEERTDNQAPSSLSTQDLCFRSPSPFLDLSLAPSFHHFSPNTSSNETYIYKRRKESDANKRLSSKGRKERLVDSNASMSNVYPTRGSKRNNKLSKQKGKLHHGRILKSRKSLGNKNKEKTRDDNRSDEDSATIDDDTVSNPGSEASTNDGLERLTFIKNALLTTLKKNWDEVIRLYLDGKLEEIAHRQITNVHFSKAYDEFYLKPRSIHKLRADARAHIRSLMFPSASNMLSVPGCTQVPWTSLGLWLYFHKKRFINWDESIPFAEFRSRPDLIQFIRVQQLKDMLLIDLVDWTEDEIKCGTTEVSLVLDPRGRVLIKVADLPRLYNFAKIDSEESVLRDEESISESRSQYESSTSPTSSVLSLSSSESSAVPLRAKRKRRACTTSSRKQIAIADSNSDGDSDSDSESGIEDSESDYTRRMVKSRMKKKFKRSY